MTGTYTVPQSTTTFLSFSCCDYPVYLEKALGIQATVKTQITLDENLIKFVLCTVGSGQLALQTGNLLL